MKSRLILSTILFSGLVLIGQSCASNSEIHSPADVNPNESEIAAIDSVNGSDSLINANGEARYAAPVYEDFTQEKYDQAIMNGEPIYLWFYANWCPTCRAQEPVNQRVFDTHAAYVHAFKIHVLDNEVSDDEKALIEQFRITKQHTAVLLDQDHREVSRTIGTRSADQLIDDLKKIAVPNDAI